MKLNFSNASLCIAINHSSNQIKLKAKRNHISLQYLFAGILLAKTRQIKLGKRLHPFNYIWCIEYFGYGSNLEQPKGYLDESMACPHIYKLNNYKFILKKLQKMLK